MRLRASKNPSPKMGGADEKPSMKLTRFCDPKEDINLFLTSGVLMQSLNADLKLTRSIALIS